MIKVGICGTTGYAGYELLRWLRRHPETHITFTTSESQAGKTLAEVFPGPLDTPLIALDDAPFHEVDMVFCACRMVSPHRLPSVHLMPERGSSTSQPISV